MKSLLLLSALAAAGTSFAAESLKPAEVDWLKKKAIPLQTCEAGHGFTDLEPLRAVIGNSRIVSLGECTHGTREVFQMKHRLLEYLATELGFTIFSIEANMPEAYRLNEYVLEGKGDPAQLIGGMYFWTWNTEEVLAMVQWMRQYNQSGKGRLEFTGFDMQTPNVAMESVLRFVKAQQPDRLEAVSQTYAKARKAHSQKRGGGGGGEESFGVATGTFPIEAAKGKKIRYRGWIKTLGLTNGSAGLWWRADGEAGVLAFDNMSSRDIKGDTEWKEYDLVLAIPEQTVNINFGALMSGQGKAWFDDFKVEIDGEAFDAGDRFDFGFEGGVIKGFATPQTGYRVVIDSGVAHTGKRSVRMESSASKGEKDPALKPGVVARECGEVLAELEAARDRLAAGTSAREADWAIQNARVVHQCLQLDAMQTLRDESMARNVEWILAHAAKNAKIVLWAHNGHVSRQKYYGASAMGAYLEERYGKQQVIIGFAAGEGQYTAVAANKGLRSDNALQRPAKGSYEECFRASGLPRFALDLRLAGKGDPASGWLTRSRMSRSIGALAMEEQFGLVNLRDCYDAIIYLDQTTASRLLEGAGGKGSRK